MKQEIKPDEKCLTQIEFWNEHLFGITCCMKAVRKNRGTANEMSLKTLKNIARKLRGRADELERIVNQCYKRYYDRR